MIKSKKSLTNIALFCIATASMILVAENTTFLQPDYYGSDSALFMYVGRGMLHGYVPYRDMYDSKGPILWLIECLGALIHEGHLGIFLIETISFNITFFLIFYTAKLYLDTKRSFIVSVIMLFFWVACIERGNHVEEYTALFSMISVYITVKATTKENKFLDKKLYVIYGLCLTAGALIRLTDCIVTVSCILYAGIELFRSKNIKELIINYIIAGISAVILLMPFVIYYAVNNALYDMIDAVLFFSMRYSNFNSTGYNIGRLAILLFPAVVSVISIIRGDRHMSVFLLVMTALCGIVYIIMGTTYMHYMLIALPCVSVMAIVLLRDLSWIGINVRTVCLVLVFCAVNFSYCRAYAIAIYISIIHSVSPEDYANLAELSFAEEAEKIIGDDHTDSVYTYHTPPVLAYILNTYSKSKYFAFQTQWQKDEITKEKIYNDFVAGDNYWVIVRESFLDTYDPRIINILNENYSVALQDEKYILYQKSE